MTLTLDLKPEIEAILREEAAKAGLDTGIFIQRTLEERLNQTANGHSLPPHLSEAESKLLNQINQGLPQETWQQYHELKARFRAEALTKEEHRTLIEISDQLEMMNAQRISYLAELARLWQMSLDDVMRKLGINQTPTYE